MNDSDLPLPADCARCPLRIPLPDELNDAVVAQLVETLYLFAAALENGCYSRLRRYWATHREPDHLDEQSSLSSATTTSPMATCRIETATSLRL